MLVARKSYLDAMAVGVSALCVVHCLALPLIFATLPFLGVFNENPLVHQVLVCVAAPLCAFALLRSGGWKRPCLVLIGLAGLVLLGLAAFLPALERHEVLLSVCGASFLALMHVINGRVLHRHGSGS